MKFEETFQEIYQDNHLNGLTEDETLIIDCEKNNVN